MHEIQDLELVNFGIDIDPRRRRLVSGASALLCEMLDQEKCVEGLVEHSERARQCRTGDDEEGVVEEKTFLKMKADSGPHGGSDDGGAEENPCDDLSLMSTIMR